MANGVEKTTGRGIMGAVVDGSSRIGKEQKVAMKMAVRDFNNSNNQSFFLQIQDSQGQPLQAALADQVEGETKDLYERRICLAFKSQELTDRQKVQAILGPQRWEEASLVAEVASQARIPIISLADATPVWATERWPFMVQASSNQDLQMRAIAAIVHSWEWYHVTVIYEDNGSSMVEEYPEEDINKPGIYAVQAYDAAWALCLAMKESYSKDGQHLLGDSESTPRGWAIPTNSKPLQIGVPNMSSFKQYVNVVHNPINNNNSFEGFAIDLFKATVASMPYFLHYKFISFQGTYDNLVEQLHLKKFDAVVGDVR
ncbi:hypothetical protein GH714_010204 [Hevea brasiliensis]|uniref:Receptor ligand binding region domain-containing protein n=1 Tax=Hevea brasiliensis TaxID=3981 RepID=A0A6A6KB28_HEVBR|nr:hypothetical protein GH714_010204 [Hevea brasiliensis]